MKVGSGAGRGTADRGFVLEEGLCSMLGHLQKACVRGAHQLGDPTAFLAALQQGDSSSCAASGPVSSPSSHT